MPSRSEHISSSNVEYLRQGLSLLVQLFIELEISSQIEAAPHERIQSRRSYRNGYRRRTWMSSLGDITIEIPKLRKGTYYPAFFDELRRSESFLLDVLRDTYHNGVDVSDIKSLVERVGLSVADDMHIADTVERIYDLIDRYRVRPQNSRPSNIMSYRPVNAISTSLVDSHITDEEMFPQSFYDQQPEDWLSDSLSVLIRLRQALSNQTDAIAA